MTADPQRTVVDVVVQTARALPATDAGWTTQRWLYFTGGSEGAGTVIGDATLEQAFGIVQPEQGRSFVSVGALPDTRRSGSGDSLIGQLVRLIKRDSAGTTRIGTRTYSAFWHGQITGQQLVADGGTGANAGGSVQFSCAGLLSLLDQITIGFGFAKPTTGTTGVVIGRMPRINELWPASASVVVNGVSMQGAGAAFNFSYAPLTAGYYIQALLFAHARGGDLGYNGLAWTFSEDGCLSYIPPPLDLNGQTILQAIEQLAGAARGIVYRVTVSGSTPTISFRSASPTAIVIGPYTLPASIDTTTFDVRNAPQLDSVMLSEDQSATADMIVVRGARPIRGITLAYDPAAPTTCALKLVISGQTTYTFTINPTWTGTNWDATNIGIRGNLSAADPAVAADVAAYGKGLTGDRTSGNYGGTGKPTAAIELLSYFPSISTTNQLRPIMVLTNGTDSFDTSMLQLKGWTLEVLNDPPSLVVDDGSFGQAIALYLAAGYKLLISLAVREIDPVMVTWKRSEGDQPRASARVRVIDVPEAIDQSICPATVTAAGVTASAYQITDALPRLRGMLALARARYGIPDYTLTLRDRGQLDTDNTGRPGQLVTTVNRGDAEQTVNVTITRRRWAMSRDGKGEWFDTWYEASRVLPDLGAVL